MYINDILKFFVSIFQWEIPQYSLYFAYYLLLSCVLIFFWDVFYIIQTLMSGILLYSKPMPFLIWFISGFSNWYFNFYIIAQQIQKSTNNNNNNKKKQ